MRPVNDLLLEEVIRRLIAKLDPEEIILFGSYAWGIPHAHSDLDLFIIVPDNIPGFNRIQWAIKALESIDDLPVPFDVLVRARSSVDKASRVPASLARKIMEEGKVLYGARKTTANFTLVN